MNVVENAINQLKQRQQLLAMMIFTLVVVMVWIGIGLITSQKNTAISADLKQKAVSLTPTLNAQILGKLEEEKYYTDDQLRDFPIYRIIDTTKRVVPTAPASPSAATPTPSPSSSSVPLSAPSPASVASPSGSL